MKRYFTVLVFLLFGIVHLSAQINTEHVMTIGRNALYFEDYVLSIQYFNQVIRSKPYLAEPYFYRGVAKLYLDDFKGAEEDCSLALERNEFMVRAYVCRSYARLKTGDFDGAITDCDRGLEYDEENKALLYNKGFALVSSKKFAEAEKSLNDLIRRFPKEVDAYMAMGQMNIERGDTLRAIEDFSRTIAIDKYYAPAWGARGWVSLVKERYANALADLNEAIRLKQDDPVYFMNRALARYNTNDLRGTMDDFDKCISLDPNSKLSYLNRAILRTTVGDLNRAVEDYDKVLFLDPKDYQAIYNRALLHKDLGHNREAVTDLNTILTRYPKFVPALYLRSDIRKRTGDAKGADRDYFAAWNIEEKAKLEKASRKLRKGTGVADTTEDAFDTTKYKRMIAAKSTEKESEKYKNPMRGRVQDKAADIEIESLFDLTYYEKPKAGPSKRLMDINQYIPTISYQDVRAMKGLIISSNEQAISNEQADIHFRSLDEYARLISNNPDDAALFLARGIDYAMVQDINNALQDLDRAIALNSNLLLAYFERANLRYKKVNIEYANKQALDEESKENQMKSGMSKIKAGTFNIGEKAFGSEFDLVMRDLDKVLAIDPGFIYAYYNRANIRCSQRDYRSALIDYTKALELNPDFAEAWFNRGITQLFLGDREHGMADLRMAGQLGLYKAYSILKRVGGEQ